MSALTLVVADISILIDRDDADLVKSVNWVPAFVGKKNKKCYAIGWSKSLKRSVFMHRIILAAKTGEIVDHINGDTLDNRRVNLRICSPTQNNGNSKYAVGKSGRRGVVETKSGMWRAYISIGHRDVHLGTTESKEAAALLYDAAAVRHFGEFATLNFPIAGV